MDEIDTEAVLQVLTPLWQETPETASGLGGRIEAVLDAARARGFIPRNEANPARLRGHHAALPYADVPAFVARLREREALGALALEFTILTTTRSGEVLGARRSEINMAGKVRSQGFASGHRDDEQSKTRDRFRREQQRRVGS